MKISVRSYAAYSIACGLVWAVILAVTTITAANTAHTLRLVFLGWLIAWTSATIARNVYPPPKSWKLIKAGPSVGS